MESKFLKIGKTGAERSVSVADTLARVSQLSVPDILMEAEVTLKPR